MGPEREFEGAVGVDSLGEAEGEADGGGGGEFGLIQS